MIIRIEPKHWAQVLDEEQKTAQLNVEQDHYSTSDEQQMLLRREKRKRDEDNIDRPEILGLPAENLEDRMSTYGGDNHLLDT
jgi:hypothetical protein